MREGYVVRSYRTASSQITIKEGQEGPRFDPYAYQEFEIVEKSTKLHMGLGTWVIVHGVRADGLSEAECVAAFEKVLGCSLHVFEKAAMRVRSRCKKCGGRPHREVSGYPGETFVLCKNGHVMDYEFDLGAVI